MNFSEALRLDKLSLVSLRSQLPTLGSSGASNVNPNVKSIVKKKKRKLIMTENVSKPHMHETIVRIMTLREKDNSYEVTILIISAVLRMVLI